MQAGDILSHKKEWSVAICDKGLERERILLRGRSQTEKDKHPTISLTRGI